MTRNDQSGEKPTYRTPPAEEIPVPEAFLLVVVEGRDKGAAQIIDASTPSRVLIGTSPTCGLRLTDPEVSRRHASARVHDRQLLIADLGSTNGTYVNGVSLREAALRGGEAIRIGRTVIAVSTRAGVALATARETSFGRVLGESLAMRRIYPLLQKAADGDRPILLEGEAGTGKELCAEEIHARSPRAVRSLLHLAANALPADTLEERLFGPDGLVRQAAGGTIFVDEVGSLPPRVQQRLLRALDAGEARFILATRRDLDRDVVEGRFEEALLARLAPARIELPPLRERAGDDAVLAHAFWRALREEEPDAPPELPADFLPRFERYAWPGNVRELLHAVRARLTLGELASWRSEAVRSRDDFTAAVIDRELPLSEARKLVIDDFERRYVSYMLARFGNTRDAARASGVAVRYLQLLRARLLP